MTSMNEDNNIQQIPTFNHISLPSVAITISLFIRSLTPDIISLLDNIYVLHIILLSLNVSQYKESKALFFTLWHHEKYSPILIRRI
jgi:hypothetical protein